MLAIVCNAAAVEIRCWSRTRDWCSIRDNVPTVSDGDKITITNADPKETVKTFAWTWPTNLKTMPSVWFETFPNMETCDLSFMGLETLTQASLENASMLKTLVLEGNNIRIIPASVFKMAANLTQIDLDDNNIVEMEDWALKGLDRLRELTMANNDIKVLRRNMLAGAPRLQKLDLSNNDIEVIEAGCLNIPQLKELDLSVNNIKNMPVDILNGAPLLKQLDLSKNWMSEIPEAIRTSKITTLVMDMNPLENVHLRDLLKMPTLEFVSLENTGIITVWPEAMTDKTTSTSMVNHLDIGSNGPMTANILKQLVALTHLQNVILDKNQLERLDLDDIKTMLPSLTVISLEDNEIDCEWLKEMIPKMTDAEIEMKTGDWDEDLPASEQRQKVDTHLCGRLLW